MALTSATGRKEDRPRMDESREALGAAVWLVLAATEFVVLYTS